MEHTQKVLKIKKNRLTKLFGGSGLRFLILSQELGQIMFYDAQFCMHVFMPCVCVCICARPTFLKIN